ncbi:hypothetical protein [Nostoc sp. 'Peltigera membranacea cyanobiont' N6]|uniref:hypothetical protein n=1 Tax=Nostoc sp. 'Peltigera membranacea cyanobiont' N6 TaxID=1261031 RepID=UPI0015E47105|nr:hypothetical protein [Nostoc sp. 'Peltigera membranacea cyanobiont' N6]
MEQYFFNIHPGLFINDVLQFVVTVLYECDRYADLTALWDMSEVGVRGTNREGRKGREGRKEKNTCDTKFL